MKQMNKILLIGILAILMIGLIGCVPVQPVKPAATVQEQKTTEDNQQTLITNQPVPKLEKSLERENLIKRLQLLNDNSKVFYVYLVSYGKVMAFYTAQGKVSSLNTYLTGKDQIVKRPGCWSDSQECWFVMESPDLDGTYGSNTDGVFFFTTEGAYVETTMDYMVSDFPLKITEPITLVREIKQ